MKAIGVGEEERGRGVCEWRRRERRHGLCGLNRNIRVLHFPLPLPVSMSKWPHSVHPFHPLLLAQGEGCPHHPTCRNSTPYPLTTSPQRGPLTPCDPLPPSHNCHPARCNTLPVYPVQPSLLNMEVTYSKLGVSTPFPSISPTYLTPRSPHQPSQLRGAVSLPCAPSSEPASP